MLQALIQALRLPAQMSPMWIRESRARLRERPLQQLGVLPPASLAEHPGAFPAAVSEVLLRPLARSWLRQGREGRLLGLRGVRRRRFGRGFGPFCCLCGCGFWFGRNLVFVQNRADLAQQVEFGDFSVELVTVSPSFTEWKVEIVIRFRALTIWCAASASVDIQVSISRLQDYKR